MIDLPIIILVLLVSLIFGYWVCKEKATSAILGLQSEIFRLQQEAVETRAHSVKATLDAYKESDELRAVLALQFESGKSQGSVQSLEEYKKSSEFKLLVDAAHAKGKLAGASEELEKFHITYTPVLVDCESLIVRKVDAGYDMQLFYAGFPIGEPTRRITNHQQKSKDENIVRVLELVETALDIAAGAAAKQKIPVTVSKTPMRVSRR